MTTPRSVTQRFVTQTFGDDTEFGDETKIVDWPIEESLDLFNWIDRLIH